MVTNIDLTTSKTNFETVSKATTLINGNIRLTEPLPLDINPTLPTGAEGVANIVVPCNANVSLNIDSDCLNSINISNIGENGSLKILIQGSDLKLLPGDLLSISNSKFTFAKVNINDDTKEKILQFVDKADSDNSTLIFDITDCQSEESFNFLKDCEAGNNNICFIDGSYSNDQLFNIYKMSPFSQKFFAETHKLENFQSQKHSINWHKILNNLFGLRGEELKNANKEIDKAIANYYLSYLNLNKEHSFYTKGEDKIELEKNSLFKISEYLLGEVVPQHIKDLFYNLLNSSISSDDVELECLGDTTPITIEEEIS